MALILTDRVKQYSNTTGLNDLSFTSTPPGFQSFSNVLSSGDTTYYAIENGNQWEVGVGSFNGLSLSRDTILSSSNSNQKVNLTSVICTVFMTIPGIKAVEKNWSTLVSQWDTEPLFVLTIDSGDVWSYVLEGINRYRLVPSPYVASEDAFYASFDGIALTGLITKRGYN